MCDCHVGSLSTYPHVANKMQRHSGRCREHPQFALSGLGQGHTTSSALGDPTERSWYSALPLVNKGL
jgi:hypothetical protein